MLLDKNEKRESAKNLSSKNGQIIILFHNFGKIFITLAVKRNIINSEGYGRLQRCLFKEIHVIKSLHGQIRNSDNFTRSIYMIRYFILMKYSCIVLYDKTEIFKASD